MFYICSQKHKIKKNMKRENSIEVIDDVITYASRYGFQALGYAIADMVRNNEIHLTSKQTSSLWEYGGNIKSEIGKVKTYEVTMYNKYNQKEKENVIVQALNERQAEEFAIGNLLDGWDVLETKEIEF